MRVPGAKVVLAGALALAVAAAWVPLRDRLPNTDLALLLVLVAGLVGWFVSAKASLVAAVAGAAAFDVLDTRPYGTLAISRGVDITTALILLVTGVLVGAGAARLASYRRSEYHRTDALAVVMEASGLIATGEEQQLVTEALSSELVRSLDLVACDFHGQPPDGRLPSVARGESLVGLVPPPANDHGDRIDLPIWCQGEVVAHYRLTLGAKRPTREELRVALSLADQAGAALAGPGPDQPPRPKPAPKLRLLHLDR